MWRPRIALGLFLPIAYVVIVIAVHWHGGEAMMFRLATDWPILLPLLYFDWAEKLLTTLHQTLGHRLSDCLEITFVAASYAITGYILGVGWERFRRWRKRRRTSIEEGPFCGRCGYCCQGLPADHPCPECGNVWEDRIPTRKQRWVSRILRIVSCANIAVAAALFVGLVLTHLKWFDPVRRSLVENITSLWILSTVPMLLLVCVRISVTELSRTMRQNCRLATASLTTLLSVAGVFLILLLWQRLARGDCVVVGL